MTLPWIYIDELQRKLNKNTSKVAAHVLKLAKPKQNMTRIECGHSFMSITKYQTNTFIMSSSSSDQLQWLPTDFISSWQWILTTYVIKISPKFQANKETRIVSGDFLKKQWELLFSHTWQAWLTPKS
jgi:hypothetical protein